ncbi:MAG: hypothetical protein H0U32_03635 [Thermoleophilaceae bacterium]|nr:hypothetical protein [Thermoleophilaceae bacterium]
MLITDDQRRLVTGNRAACAMLGIARDDVSWLTMDRFTPASERRRLQEQWAAFLTAGAAAGCYTLEVANQEPGPVEFGAASRGHRSPWTCAGGTS